MSENNQDTTVPSWPLLAMGVILFTTLFIWPFVFAKDVIEYIRANFIDLYALPEPLVFLAVFPLSMGPFIVALVASAYWYQRWYSSHRNKLAQEQLAKLGEARKALMVTVSYIETFERELREKNAETEKLNNELASLKSLNAETAADLQRKLAALEILNRRKVWLERILSFAIGVGSSLVASYAWQYAQPPSPSQVQQSNPAVERDASPQRGSRPSP